jgi:phenylacetic acid degradation operon negative regulatory protein
LPRQRRQDGSRTDRRRPWNGRWTMVVVNPAPEPQADPVELAGALAELRFGLWRDGVWLRPDNLGPRRHLLVERHCTVWNAGAPDELDGRRLAARLWDLDGWATRARCCLQAFPLAVRADDRFRLAAAVMLHLQRDPLLPDGLIPSDWPGPELRRSFDCFARELQVELGAFLRGG